MYRCNIRRVPRVMRKATGIRSKKVFLNPFNIQLIEPKDHFFDSEDRAERKHAKRKNATIAKFGAPCKGIKPIRQYHQCNEEKILPHKRLGFDFQE